ncbi:aldo/keto reductase [Baekduia alba]|uniref:aldo/keto reductase n=1 Tax=Baekduia alba TaxID=2997333 RepID=UPI003D79AD47
MRYRLLGATGLRVSELCLGAMVFGDRRGRWGADAAEAARIVARFADAGGNFIDTANHYAGGESERIVGDLIGPDRDRWVLATKYALSSDPRDPNAGGTSRKSLRRALDASLRRLGTDYIDLYWVHIWDAFTPVEEVIGALDDQVRAGKILYIGISDTPAWLVARAVTLAQERGLTPFTALQVPYSLVERTVERELLPMARMLDLAVTGWAPLGGGLLTGRYGTDRERPQDTRVAGIGGSYEQRALSERNLAIADALNAVAQARGASASQVAIAWLLVQQRRAVTIPIVGTRTLAQLTDNLGALDLELEAGELEQLDAVSAVPAGFPGDFGGAALAYGSTLDRVEDHRGAVDVIV